MYLANSLILQWIPPPPRGKATLTSFFRLAGKKYVGSRVREHTRGVTSESELLSSCESLQITNLREDVKLVLRRTAMSGVIQWLET